MNRSLTQKYEAHKIPLDQEMFYLWLLSRLVQTSTLNGQNTAGNNRFSKQIRETNFLSQSTKIIFYYCFMSYFTNHLTKLMTYVFGWSALSLSYNKHIKSYVGRILQFLDKYLMTVKCLIYYPLRKWTHNRLNQISGRQVFATLFANENV